MALLAGAIVLCVVVAVVAAVAAGSVRATELVDPGAVVRYGLPVTDALSSAAAALTTGCLMLAVLAVPAASRERSADLDGPRALLVRVGAVAGAVWAVLGLVKVLLTTADVLGEPLTTAGFGRAAWAFVVSVPLGQSLVSSWLATLVSVHLAAFARRINTACWAFAFAVVSLLALALSGHAGSSYDHHNAVNSLSVHVVAVSLWVGGLAALVIAAPRLGRALRATAARYSTIALWCFVAVAASGTVNASIRVSGPGDLVTSAYGWMLLGKTAALVALGGFGVWQRSRLLPGLADRRTGRRAFRRFAAVEVMVMAVAMGLAAALSRTAPPVPQDTTLGPDARAESLTGFPLPPEFTMPRLVTVWQWDWAIAAVGAVFAAVYIAGVVRLRRRGDSWPLRRTVPWLLGCVVFVWATNGGPAAYGMIRFDVHMVEHMTLMMVVPPLWVLGAPVTLLSRAVTPRRDGSRSVREWVLVVLHSRYSQFLAKAPVAGVIFAGSLLAFYFTPMFQWTMFSHVGHMFMIVHFVLTGYLFSWVLIGVDPGPHETNYPIRLVVLFATLAYHAFFGLAILAQQEIIGAFWYESLGLYDADTLYRFQQQGGSIMWAVSEIPTVALAIGVVSSWVRSDERLAKRLDRQADRDDDAELRAYNEQLRRMAVRDRETTGDRPVERDDDR